jgi:hypothetical protein
MHSIHQEHEITLPGGLCPLLSAQTLEAFRSSKRRRRIRGSLLGRVTILNDPNDGQQWFEHSLCTQGLNTTKEVSSESERFELRDTQSAAVLTAPHFH